MLQTWIPIYELLRPPTYSYSNNFYIKATQYNSFVLILSPSTLSFTQVKKIHPPFGCGTTTKNYLFINSSLYFMQTFPTSGNITHPYNPSTTLQISSMDTPYHQKHSNPPAPQVLVLSIPSPVSLVYFLISTQQNTNN